MLVEKKCRYNAKDIKDFKIKKFPGIFSIFKFFFSLLKDFPVLAAKPGQPGKPRTTAPKWDYSNNILDIGSRYLQQVQTSERLLIALPAADV